MSFNSLPDERNIDEPVNDNYDNVAHGHHEWRYLQWLQYQRTDIASH